MNKIESYRLTLRTMAEWDDYLLRKSGLPGPRSNLELAQAVAQEGNEALFRRYLSLGPDVAPTNTPREFLPCCAVIGLGRLAAEGRTDLLEEIRRCASDTRWRMREGVAMALQRYGDADTAALLREMEDWSVGKLLERRAVVAALCEPRLLKESESAARVLQLLDQITASLLEIPDRKGLKFDALRKTLGYGWSVAAVALPDEGKRLMEKWFAHADKDIRWIMRENLGKSRLARMDAEWVARWRSMLG
jgi:hypothetical protein